MSEEQRPYKQAPHNPYQAPRTEVYDDGYDYDTQYEYAGFWMRFLASVIDSVIFFIALGLPLVLIGNFTGIDPWDSTEFGVMDVISNVLSVVIYVFFWVKYAGTPGKRLLKLKILDADTGEHLSVGKAIIRYIGYIPSALVLFLGFIWVAFDARKQGWHDKMANSVVVKEL